MEKRLTIEEYFTPEQIDGAKNVTGYPDIIKLTKSTTVYEAPSGKRATNKSSKVRPNR